MTEILEVLLQALCFWYSPGSNGKLKADAIHTASFARSRIYSHSR